MKMKILFWSPHTAIWQHSYPESIVANSLKSSGDDVIFISCDGAFQSYCTAMNAYGLLQDSDVAAKRNICEICVDSRKMLSSRFRQKNENLSSYLTEKDVAEIDRLLTTRDRNQLFDFHLDGIPIFRIGIYEILLQYKKNNFIFTDEEWNSCLISFRNTLIAFLAGKTILDKHKPDKVLIYNTLYSVNHVIQQLSEKRGIPAYIVHAGDNLHDRLSSLYISRKYPGAYRESLKSHWPVQKEIHLTQSQIDRVVNHFRVLFEGAHFLVYSSGSKGDTDIKKIFQIPLDTKKIIIATLSSYDERFASEAVGSFKVSHNSIFKNQIEWVRFVLDYIRQKPEYFLIIRVHPREFPNKRESMQSEHAEQLRRALKNLPQNAAINWPDDKVSLYDLAKEADLFLNAWSSVGEEMSFLGIPVLIFSQELIAYPSDLNYLAKNTEDYTAKIEEALATGWNGSRVIAGFRWYNLKFDKSLFHISEDFGNPDIKWRRYSKFRLTITIIVAQWRLVIKEYIIYFFKFLRRYPRQLMDLTYQQFTSDSGIHDMLMKGSDTKLGTLDDIPAMTNTSDDADLIKSSMRILMDSLFTANDGHKKLYRELQNWYKGH